MLKKLLSAGVMLALVATVLVGVGASTASAQNVTCANIDVMLSALGVTDAAKVAQAKVAFGCGAASTVTSSGYTFTRNLTIGSTGADVTALQTKLGVTPATGYFGAITKAAVIAYQTANGISGTGYVGPLTLAKLNASVVVAPVTPVTPACPAGMTCTPTVACPAGFTCTPASGAVTTTGVEGTLTVKTSTIDLPSTLYQGDSQVGVIAFKAEAKDSDIAIQRVKIGLGNSSDVYRKVFSKIYVTDGSSVVASSDLNSTTVTKEDDNSYSITLSGMNVVVAKGGSKILTVKVDVMSTIDSTIADDARIFTIVADGVRGVDGVGINQFSPATAFSRTISSISVTLAERATLKLSTNASTPKTASIVASSGTDKDEADKVVGFMFNLKAEKDTVQVTDLNMYATGTAVAAEQITTAYLYDGATEIANAEVASSSGLIEFTDISDLFVSKDTTKVLTVKFDVRNATSSVKAVVFNIGNADITAENTLGDTIVTGTYLTGSAAGNTINVVASGPVLTLTSKNLTKSTSVVDATTTVTYTGTFNFRVLAGAQDLVMGKVASSSPFAATTSFAVYEDGILNATPSGFSAIRTSFNDPSSTVTDTGVNSMLLADGNEVDISVTVTVVLINPASGHTLAVQVKDILGLTYMANQTDWRTNAI